MKSLILFYILLFATCFASAQKFTIAVTPSAQSVPIGQTATYSVAITPIDGFDATVFLSVSSPSFNGTSSFSTIIPSPPYVNVTLQITPNYLDTGSRTFIVTGKNGDVESTATFSLIVPKNVQWTTINAPQQIKVAWTSRTFGKDANSDVCFVNGDDKAVYFNHFRNKQWETEIISTSLNFTGFDIPFVYDKTNVLWFLTPQGIARYDGKFTTIINKSNSGIKGDVITNMILGSNGYPICLTNTTGTQETAFEQFDGTQWKSIIVNKKAIPNLTFEATFCKDSSNNIWVASPTCIIRIHDTTPEVMYQFSPTWNYKSVRKIISDKDGGIWCLYHYPADFPGVKFEESISYFDGKTWKHLPVLKGEARDLIIDDNKKVWVASYIGLYNYDGNAWIAYNSNNSPLPKPTTTSGGAGVLLDKNKNIWVMVQSEGVQFFAYNPYGLVNVPLPPTDVKESVEPIDGISLSPNPVSSVISISGLDGVSSLSIVNSLGVKVRNSLVEGTKTNVDVSNFTSGMYFVQFNTQTGMISKAIMVSH